MATKVINGSYPTGYQLDPGYDTLKIGSPAYVGGAGVTTTQTSTVNNLGKVHGTGNGISLSAGGTISNGNSRNATALVEGLVPISVDGAQGTVTNSAVIQSDTQQLSDTQSYAGPSIVLNLGGSVTNSATGTISNGVSIAGAAGSVVNGGTIGGPSNVRYLYPDTTNYFVRDYGPSIRMTAGGSVTNGSKRNTAASVTRGIYIAGGTGSVTNNGTVDGTYYRYLNDGVAGTYEHQQRGPSVFLKNGGTVYNGTGGNTSASLTEGVSINGAGTVINNGLIGGGLSIDRFPVDTVQVGYSIGLDSGTVINGSVTDTSASVQNGVSIGNGTVTNYGSIGGAYHRVSYYPFYSRESGAGINGAGTLTNGSAADTVAAISGYTGVKFSGTVVNFGTISSTSTKGNGAEIGGTITNYGTISGYAGVKSGDVTVVNFGTISSTNVGGGRSPTAVWLTSSSGVLVEEGTGILNGAALGDGGTLKLAGDAGYGVISGIGSSITQFATIEVEANARWRFTGTNTIGRNQTLHNLGTLVDKSALSNGGSILNDGVFKIATVDIARSHLFTNTGLVQKTGNTKTASIAGAVVNTGTVEVTIGTLDLEGAVTGVGGTLQIDGGAALQADAAVSVDQTLRFTGADEKLVLTDAPQFKAMVAGFGSGDTLDLTQFGAGTTLSFTENVSNSGGTLIVKDADLTAKIALLGQYAAAGFQLASDGHGGSLVTYTPPSAANTLTDHIAAPHQS